MKNNYFNDLAGYVKKFKVWKKSWIEYEFCALAACRFLEDTGYSRRQMKRLLGIHFNHFSEREIETILDANEQLSELDKLIPETNYKPGDKVAVDPGVTGKEEWVPGMVTSGSKGQGKDSLQVILCYSGEVLKAAEAQLRRISRFQTIKNN